MSFLLRVRGLYLLNKQEKCYLKIAWIAEIADSQIVADRKGNAFIMEKFKKNCYAFYCYHCYLSTLALLSIEIIDSLGSLSCRQYFLRFNFIPHIFWTFIHSCHLAVYKLLEGGRWKLKYFHSMPFLGLTDTVKSKINIQERKIVNDHETECYSKKIRTKYIK